MRGTFKLAKACPIGTFQRSSNGIHRRTGGHGRHSDGKIAGDMAADRNLGSRRVEDRSRKSHSGPGMTRTIRMHLQQKRRVSSCWNARKWLGAPKSCVNLNYFEITSGLKPMLRFKRGKESIRNNESDEGK